MNGEIVVMGIDVIPVPAWFVEAAAGIGVEFEAGDLEKLGRYLALLLETNKTHNLTAVTDPGEAWRRHVLDSLTLMAVMEEQQSSGAEQQSNRTAEQQSGTEQQNGGAAARQGDSGAVRVIDVGSGGGLPGAPLAIVMPGVEFTLLEATGKKAEFLRRVAAELGLANVRVVQERAERAGRSPEHRERYDMAVARAVGPMAVIAELAVPFVKAGGSVLLIKGQKAEEELAAAKKALHALHAVHAGTVETPTGRIVVLDKPRKTPGAYPRADGEPKRRPL